MYIHGHTSICVEPVTCNVHCTCVQYMYIRVYLKCICTRYWECDIRY